MVDDLGIGIDIGGVASGAATAIADLIIWVVVILGVIAILVIGFLITSFKQRVRIRKVLRDGRSIIIDDKARVFKDRDKAVWWKTWKTKLKLAEPPVEALEINSKGKTYAEGYLLSDGKFVWRNNDFNYKHLQETSAQFVQGGYDALTSQERALYAKELRESEAYKKKKIGDLIAVAAPYIAIILIFALFVIFYADMMAPATQMSTELRGAADSIKEAMSMVKDIVQHRETIWLEQMNQTGTIPN